MIVGASSDGYVLYSNGSRVYNPLGACEHFAALAEAAEERAELAPDPHRMRELEREVERMREALGYVQATLEDPGDYLVLDVQKMLTEVRRALADSPEVKS